MTHILLVSAGAFFGAIARFGFGNRWNKGHFPWGTFAVNLIGSFLLGLIYGSGASRSWVLILGTGFMGSFTTFSTFKLENLELALKKNWISWMSYSFLTYAGGLLLAWLGLHLVY
ncbi:MAG TPA: CrcB family protein [Sporolactobacillaceae bacterium]|nr:CrcB family protein [Sporolactobacillaceae bacterium]